MRNRISLALIASGLSVVIVSLMFALVLGVIGPGTDSPTGMETAVLAVAGTDSNGVVAPAPGDGIKVHGLWTIEVLESDGTFVSRQVFETSLTNDGAVTLARILARTRSVGLWRLEIKDGSGSNHPCLINTSPAACLLLEPPGVDVPNASFNLTKGVTISGTNQNKLVLSGHATAWRNGIVSNVIAVQRLCFATVAPSGCPTSTTNIAGLVTITGTNITAIPVQNGQQILVTVVISFS